MTSPITRRAFGVTTGAGLLATAPGLRGPALAAPSGQIVVGTWGGDYQNLQQAHIADPLMKPMGVETVFDTGNDTVRKTKLMAERRLPRGSLDLAALTASGSYEMWKNGALEEIDETKVPNLKHVLPQLKTTYSAPHIYTGRVLSLIHI